MIIRHMIQTNSMHPTERYAMALKELRDAQWQLYMSRCGGKPWATDLPGREFRVGQALDALWEAQTALKEWLYPAMIVDLAHEYCVLTADSDA